MADTHINHRECRRPDEGSFPETLGQLGYHDDLERSANIELEEPPKR